MSPVQDETAGLGRIHLRQHQPDLALAPLARALAIREQKSVAPDRLADTRFALAQALWETHRDRRRALELARSAKVTYASQGEAKQKEFAVITRWLDARQ